ncbi:MAG: apolipoprotein N-acyltransferase [Kordiimonas sp.]|nr:apolipoprotein N-acyltransferase [Kordiimonas sp.]
MTGDEIKRPKSETFSPLAFGDRVMRLPAIVLLPLLGGMSALAFAPLYVFPVIFFCYPILWGVVERASGFWRAMAFGLLFGIGHFAGGLYWVGYAFFMQDAVSNWAAVPAVFGLAAGLAIFPAVICGVYWSVSRRLKLMIWAKVLFFCLCWAVGEWLRGHILTGFPWNLLGYVWGFSDGLLQVTAYGGIYGLGLLTILWAMSPALFFQSDNRTIGYWWSGIAVLTFLMAGVWGQWRLSHSETGYVEDVVLRVVQGNIDQRNKWHPAYKAENFLRYIDLSMKSGRETVTHVIWPETAVPYLIDEEPSRRFLMTQALNPGGYLLTGAVRLQRQGEDISLWNSLHILDDKGEIRASYDKSHLVPFGEYMPLRSLMDRLGIAKLVPGDVDYSAGPGLQTLRLPGLPAVSPLICYEVIFPGAAHDSADRPQWLLNVTNDAWYGHTSGPYQHLLQSRVRAVEDGIPLVRAAGTGISAIVDPYGRIRASIPLGHEGIIDHKLSRALEKPTFYSTKGELPFWGTFVILIFVVVRYGRDESGIRRGFA